MKSASPGTGSKPRPVCPEVVPADVPDFVSASQSASACTMRSRRLETKFQRMKRGPSGAPPTPRCAHRAARARARRDQLDERRARIVHSKRTPDDLRGVARRGAATACSCGSRCRRSSRKGPPGFAHTAARDIPELVLDGVRVRVLVGQAFGRASPVATASPTLYLDLLLAPGATLELPKGAAEQALYGVDQGFEIDAAPVPAFTLAVRGRRSRTGSVERAIKSHG